MVTLVRAAVLTNYLEVASHLGLDVNSELRAVGLSRSSLQDPDQPIPIMPALMLLENGATASQCMTFGLRMAESRQFSDLGAISLLLTHQPDLRSALQVMVQHRNLLNPALAIYVEDTAESVVIHEEVVADSPVSCRQANELAVAVMARLCATLLGPAWRPTSVNFSHGTPGGDLSIYKRIFGCKVVFDARFNGLVCPSAALDAPNPNADPAMARYAQRFVDSLQKDAVDSLVYEVRKAIYLLLPMGRATIEQIALALGMNVRTLQRRLEENDANFSDLINEVRRDLVQRYMQNPTYTLARIGELLGYSLPSSFSRWFSGQFGASPVAWRNANGKPYQPNG